MQPVWLKPITYLCSYVLTLSTWACEACANICKTTSKYFLNSGPILSAMSPNTERIWGFTDRWTVLSWKTKIQNYIYHRKYCAISSTTWIHLPLLLISWGHFVTKLNDTGKPVSFFRKQFLKQLGKHLQTKIFTVNTNSIVQCSELN